MINLLWIIPVILVVHELGHMIVWKYYGVNPKRIVLSKHPLGIGVEYKADRSNLNKETQAWGALGGPLASGMLAVATLNVSPELSKASALIALLNLLPIKGSDGRRIAEAWKQN